MSQGLVGLRHHIVMALALAGASPAAAGQSVDLQLVLAVDASGSVDETEYALQLKGIAAGFRDRAVRKAIKEGAEGRIAVNLITWAEHQVPKDQTGWMVIGGDAEAESFALLVEALPRTQNGGTGLGEGIAASVRAINSSGFESERRVIDVSGDGKETPAREFVVLLPQARIMANSYKITINGLAIANEDAELLSYYLNNVRSGPDSFVMAADNYVEFADAMRRKLLREIDYKPKLSLR
jgi:hypothetical protein